jgi:hypothetical protein
MIFYKLKIISSLWDDLEIMVKNHYETEENTNSVLCLGTYLHQSVDEIKLKFLGKKVIVYQLEQLVDNHWWSIEHIINNIKNADEIWDYDLENIQVLKSYGISAKFMPIKYTESLKRIENKKDPDIDVLFYGTLTPRRYNIIANMINSDYYYNHINFVYLFNFDDKKLDDYISRSKIILNIHPNENHRQEQVRIYYPLINNKCVISEISSINYFGDLILEREPEYFRNTIFYYLQNDLWKSDFENVSEKYKKFKLDVKL